MKRPEPERTCLACRRRRPKAELLRIVRSPDGAVGVDPLGRADGRGAYVCRDNEPCLKRTVRPGALSRALRATLEPDDLARLAVEMEKESVKA